MSRTRLTPYLLLAILMLGSGLGIGLGLSESPARFGWAAVAASANPTLGPTSQATRYAETLLFKLNDGDLKRTVPLQPCSFVSSGTMGPLTAPYRVCAVSTAEGHIVNFVAIGRPPTHGITFTDRGSETFLDSCYMHLVGSWYAFQAANLSNPAAPCNAPWKFHGGP